MAITPSPVPTNALTPIFTPVPFPYNTTVISEEQFTQHITLYNGYFTQLNGISADLSDLSRSEGNHNGTDAGYRGLKNGETYSLDGIILHEEYFRNITKPDGISAGAETINLINTFFGSFDVFVKDFRKCALSARGWCVLAYEQRAKTLRNLMLDSHNDGVVVMAYPLLVLDMYEHAYFLDYKTDKKKYIDAFIGGINWNVVEKRVVKVAEDLRLN